MKHTIALKTLIIHEDGAGLAGLMEILYSSEALPKLPSDHNCHAEAGEDSRIFKKLEAYPSFRITEKPVLQEALPIPSRPAGNSFPLS
jgi:hypothetical protein